MKFYHYQLFLVLVASKIVVSAAALDSSQMNGLTLHNSDAKIMNSNIDMTEFLEIFNKIPTETDKCSSKISLAYITPWNKRANQLIAKYINKFDLVVPVWFDLKPEEIKSKYNTNIDGSNYVDKELIKMLKEKNKNVKIIPRFNCQNFNSESFELMLKDDNTNVLIRNIIKRVKFSKFDGITLECMNILFNENLTSKFINFIEKLYKALQKENKILINTLFPYSTNLEHSINKIRFDYLMKFSDFMVIMTYDYHQYMLGENYSHKYVKNSPEDWISKTLNYYMDISTFNQLREKILIGIPFHGLMIDRNQPIDNNKNLKGKLMVYEDIKELASKQPEFMGIWIKDQKEHMFEVNLTQQSFLLTLPTPDFIKHRLDYVNKNHFAGISIWELGQGYEYLLEFI